MTEDPVELLRRSFAPRYAAMQDGTMAAKLAAMREMREQGDWDGPVAGTDPDAPPPTIPDWRKHIGECRRYIRAVLDTADDPGLSDRLHGTSEVSLRWLCQRLTSRHMPVGHAEATPGLPWAAIRLWRSLSDRAGYSPPLERLDPPAAVIDGWAKTEAAAWLPHLAKLEEWLMKDGGRPSGNHHSPILWSNACGESGWLEFSARIPADAMPAIRAAIAAAVAEAPPPPTLEEVRKILENPEISERLRALGVQRLWVYGSVAAGTAGAGSDVDVLATMRASALGNWGEVAEVLEGALRRLVDLHAMRTDEQATEQLRGKTAAVVWENRG